MSMTREDTFKITREDVLRELELLPGWTLRAPLPEQSIIESTPLTAEPTSLTIEPEPLAIEPAPLAIEPAPLVIEKVQPVLVVPVEPNEIEKDSIETSQAVSSSAVFITSDDKKWVFVLPEAPTGQAADLFNNILRALSINKTQTSQTQDLMQDIAGLNVGVVVAVGEKIAQQLFASTQPLEILRGKIHDTNGLQVVATYHPDDLLLHLPNKAKTWDDLCIALDAISH